MNIEFRDGLLFTSVEISYKGYSKLIDNIVIDTGAAESIISPVFIIIVSILGCILVRKLETFKL